MEFFETVQKRRSIRRFNTTVLEDEKIEKALQAAILAPNSSNVQTWKFHWVKNEAMKKKLVHICLNQSGARTASGLIVVTADPADWRRSQAALIKWVSDVRAPQPVMQYYKYLIPIAYRWGIFNSLAILKSLISTGVGIFRPITRGPNTKAALQLVAAKSAALACENFMLAITAQGGATLPMEGYDSFRLKRLLKLRSSAIPVMVIGVGYEAERGTWGPQMRLPLSEVLKVYN